MKNARLYGIVDLGYVSPDRAVSVSREMIRGGVGVIQLRAKETSASRMLEVAQNLATLCAEERVPLILNDRPGMVGPSGAVGAHVGQDDLPVAEARRLAGTAALIGKSTHSLEQAKLAVAEGADYIGFGPLFATPTKPDYEPVGLEDVRAVHEAVSIPVFCIGGIKRENLADVMAAGARRVVIVSGILQADDVEEYCREV
ncbi:MAG: thiamine phosphate synthase, partial [Chthoniobacterales bacterium]